MALKMGALIEQDELKELEFSILADIDSFCKANGIRYFLAYGTLLGAVRHKGFIPWDDDIDVWMPRRDYDRFMKEYRHDCYKASCAELDPLWKSFIAKVCDTRTIIDEGHGDTCGVYVDVFPLDGMPGTERKRRLFFTYIRCLMALWSNQHYTKKMKVSRKNTFGKNVKIVGGRIVGIFLSEEFFLKRIMKQRRRFSYDDSEYIAGLCETPIAWVPRIFGEELSSMEFEGHGFSVPAHYDEWLRVNYGDYMQLPPPEQRVNTHGFRAYWKE